MATTYLHRTPSSSSNQRKWTFSTWIKRGVLSVEEAIVTWLGSGSEYTQLRWQGADTINFAQHDGSGYTGRLNTNALFRDVAAWYHLVCVWDTDNAAAGDRMRLYINGVEETSFSTDTNPALNLDSYANSTNQLTIGSKGAANYFTGSMAHTHFCDGQAYAASDFGETDSTSGIWVAKPSPSVTYGTNGFFLKYASGASGTDSSGEGNNMTVSGTMTQTKDTPDNNFCTINPLYNFRQGSTFQNGNTTLTTGGNATPNTATMGLQAGKWYFEAKAVSAGANANWMIGLVSMFQTVSNTELGNYNKDWGYYGDDGNYRNNNTNTAYGDTYGVGDFIGCAFDLDNMKLYFSKNGVWQNSGDPAAGTNGISMTEDTSSNPVPWMQAYFPAVCGDSNGQNYTWSTNFGNGYFGTTSAGASNADDAGIGIFKYDVPAGFYAICTNNLQSYGG